MEKKSLIQFNSIIYGNALKKFLGAWENFSIVKVSHESMIVAWLKGFFIANITASPIFFDRDIQAPILDTIYCERRH